MRAVHGQQPCTVMPAAEGVEAVVVRLSNARAEGMNNTNRVQNEVASMHLVRAALAQLGNDHAGLVPAVYAWKAATPTSPKDEAGFGWTIMEYKTGVPLDEHFSAVPLEEKLNIVEKVAAIFSAIQGVKLPPNVTCHGGLTIGNNGQVMSGQGTLQEMKGGPWKHFAESWAFNMQGKLKEADESEVIGGWTANGLRNMVEDFIVSGLSSTLRDAEVDATSLVLLHKDFTLNNMLFDTETNRISAILDFDWAGVGHPCEEFFTSLVDLMGTTRPIYSEGLQNAILSGHFHDNLAADSASEEEREAWELAKAWDAALLKHGAIRPSDIKGMVTLEKLRSLTDLLAPFELANKAMLKRRSAVDIAALRARTEEAIVKGLGQFNFGG
ncbi:hypothetical protein JDV02_002063 [Purpureocillium takamizusanense]|nr:uncharacterized protein JDV02_002063 [Purpureocillium takamizusanense]UNI15537.1 hypothetical protein JDV02_002063 [Purpureocillium takamizusanense]